MAGDVMTTATAGAEGAARIGESAETAQHQRAGAAARRTRDGDQAAAVDARQPAVVSVHPATPGVSDGGCVGRGQRHHASGSQTRQGSRLRRSPPRPASASAAAWPGSEHSGGPA